MRLRTIVQANQDKLWMIMDNFNPDLILLANPNAPIKIDRLYSMRVLETNLEIITFSFKPLTFDFNKLTILGLCSELISLKILINLVLAHPWQFHKKIDNL